eukprot:CAMPEP_0194587038 /NCGR_PEP_ID=MMETSP0292-20121207/18869_1 /TAXON_ID=39354 /ORGANISM="Heterosigma akashiwo, Strain CCMP2393" /LENGTH=203 /DNA_ID=CAMNT_0039443119 /DNA_START=251 /DNA_END=860 /DNA_ORIENTATION=-
MTTSPPHRKTNLCPLCVQIGRAYPWASLLHLFLSTIQIHLPPEIYVAAVAVATAPGAAAAAAALVRTGTGAGAGAAAAATAAAVPAPAAAGAGRRGAAAPVHVAPVIVVSSPAISIPIISVTSSETSLPVIISSGHNSFLIFKPPSEPHVPAALAHDPARGLRALLAPLVVAQLARAPPQPLAVGLRQVRVRQLLLQPVRVPV